MRKISNNRGVTLTALVITIILLLILAGVAISAGKSSIDSARLTTYGIELQTMQNKVNELNQELIRKQKNNAQNEAQAIQILGKNLQNSEQEAEAFAGAGVTDKSGYRYYDKETVKELGFPNYNQEFLVNIEKRSVISLNGIEYEGETKWTSEELDESYNVEYSGIDSEITFDLSSIENKIYINNITTTGDVKKYSVYYGQGTSASNVDWRIAQNETTETNCTIEVYNEGNYYVKVVDSAGNVSATEEENVQISRMAITNDVEDVYAIEGRPATFTANITATGKGSVTYQWYKCNNPDKIDKVAIEEATSETYTIPAVTMDMNNTYYFCEIVQINETYRKELSTRAAKLTIAEVTVYADITELTMLDDDEDVVNLGGENVGEWTIANIAQNSDYATSYEDEYIQAIVNGSVLTITAKSYTANTITLSARESNAGKTVAIVIRMKNKYEVVFNSGDRESDYIESTGTQYILTDYYPKTNTKIELNLSFNGTFQAPSATGKGGAFLGSIDNNHNVYTINFGANSGQYNTIFPWFNKEYGYGSSIESFGISDAIRTNRNTLTIDPKNGKVTYSTASKNITKKTVDNAEPLCLFGRNKDGEILPFGSYNMRLYSLTISEDGIIKKHMVPSYSAINDEVGLYDTVEEKFWGNNGTGTFNRGETINYHSTQQFIYGTAQNLTANTYTRKGHTFTGWNTNPDGTGTAYADGQEVNNLTTENNGKVNLYAQWSANNYTLTFDTNSGTVTPATKTVTYGQNYGELPTPTRNGYEFKGWKLNSEDSSYVTAETTVSTASNHTLIAQWEATYLKASTYTASPTAQFLGTSITRNKIKKVSFEKSIAGHIVDNENCFDVTAPGTTNQVLLWVTNTDEDGNKEIVIGQNGGVKANPQSTSLFAYIGYSMPAEIDLNNFYTDDVINIERMFQHCRNVAELDVSNFNTSNAINMLCIFYECSSLTELDVSGFNTGNVTNMSYMFYGCSRLTELAVSRFNTDNVTSMNQMFYGCSGLTELDVSNFNTSNVTIMSYMFYNCNKVTKLDLSNFNTANVTTMERMFQYCSSLTELDLSNFDTSKVTNMLIMFYGCSSLTELDVSNFNTSNVTTLSSMFYGCSSLVELDVSGFNTSKVTTMANMFYSCSGLTELNVSNFNTANVTNMAGMFQNCSGLTELDLSNFDTRNVTNMDSMFRNCSNLTKIDLSNFDTSKVTNMGKMFNSCSKIIELDVSNFNTSNVTSMVTMFYNCSKLTTLDLSNFNTGNVTTMERMFQSCSNVSELYVSSFNTNNVTNMSLMFYGCSGLTELDVSNFNTSNVTNMEHMFNGCSNLTQLDVSRFNTSNVTTMDSMFRSCSSLTKINLDNFNTSNVTRMSAMFYSCTNLQTIYVSSSFTTNKVNNSENMFAGNTNLVGGAGTAYNSEHRDHAYAHIDGGELNPGYFTDVVVLENP